MIFDFSDTFISNFIRLCIIKNLTLAISLNLKKKLPEKYCLNQRLKQNKKQRLPYCKAKLGGSCLYSGGSWSQGFTPSYFLNCFMGSLPSKANGKFFFTKQSFSKIVRSEKSFFLQNSFVIKTISFSKDFFRKHR